MSRLARAHVESALRQKFPDADVEVVRDPGGLRIGLHWPGADSMIAITGDEPGTVLAALLARPKAGDA